MKDLQELETVLAEGEKKFGQDPNFVEMNQMVKDLQALGLLQKPKYDIAPMDTIGKRLYESCSYTTW
ncbi:hypothetical protein [Hymenobacter nivis]|uniref:hypothetical protein n=1 Tax=Hymenobacter nivis TaxID=1850093 RepID=UPI0013A53506|nr:hypothetical protein [Hymenobacter nivis]